jgi:hypothetical protein
MSIISTRQEVDCFLSHLQRPMITTTKFKWQTIISDGALTLQVIQPTKWSTSDRIRIVFQGDDGMRMEAAFLTWKTQIANSTVPHRTNVIYTTTAVTTIVIILLGFIAYYITR